MKLFSFFNLFLFLSFFLNWGLNDLLAKKVTLKDVFLERPFGMGAKSFKDYNKNNHFTNRRDGFQGEIEVNKGRRRAYMKGLAKGYGLAAFQVATFPFRLLARPIDSFARRHKDKIKAKSKSLRLSLEQMERIRKSEPFILALGDCEKETE